MCSMIDALLILGALAGIALVGFAIYVVVMLGKAIDERDKILADYHKTYKEYLIDQHS